MLRTQLGKGKLAGVRLRPAVRGVAAVPVLRRTVCAAGIGSGIGCKKTEGEPLLPASGGNRSRGEVTRNREAAAVTPPRQLRVRKNPSAGAGMLTGL